MQSKVVAILETRTGKHLAELVARQGGIPMLAPALEEVPDVDPQALSALLQQWRAQPFTMVIFQTGVGTRALFAATDARDATAEILALLRASLVVVRGPKPVGELNSREVRIDVRARSPFTSEMVLEAIADVPLAGGQVLVQRYGEANSALCAALTARGAAVQEIATYRWALPADTRPLIELLDALAESRVDALVFTSAVQVRNLFAVAAATGRPGVASMIKGLVIASIGPVCSRALRQHGIEPSFEASPPKLGPLVTMLADALR